MVAFVAVLIAVLGGCTKSREQAQVHTEKADTVRLTGTVSMPGSDGVPVLLPIDLTADRQGTEQATEERERQTSLDGAAIGREIGAAVRAAIGPASGGALPSLSAILETVTGAGTMAGLGYLALKKRQQIRKGL